MSMPSGPTCNECVFKFTRNCIEKLSGLKIR